MPKIRKNLKDYPQIWYANSISAARTSLPWPSFIAIANDGVSTVHNWCKKVSGGGAFARIRLNAPHSGKRPPFSLVKLPAKRPGSVNPGSYGMIIIAHRIT